MRQAPRMPEVDFETTIRVTGPTQNRRSESRQLAVEVSIGDRGPSQPLVFTVHPTIDGNDVENLPLEFADEYLELVQRAFAEMRARGLLAATSKLAIA